MDRSGPGLRITVLADPKAPEGVAVPALATRIREFVFEDDAGKADRFILTLENNDLALFEADGRDLLPGSYLEVSWGYPGAFSPPRRMVIKSIKGGRELKVEGVALSVQAHREARTRVWHSLKRSDVARLLATELGYDAPEIEDTAEVLETINQVGETDAAFLRRMAGREHYEFRIDETGFHFHPRRADSAPTHVFAWYADETGTILDWSVDQNLMRSVGKVTVRGRDPVAKKDIEASASADTVARPTLGEVIEVVDPESGQTHLERANASVAIHRTRATTQVEAQREADGRFRRAELAAVKLSATIVGEPTLRAKTVVELRGLSSAFSGRWYVTWVKHTIGQSGYTTEARFSRDGKAKLAGGAAMGTSQGGDRNRQAAPEPGGVEELERVDGETGRTTIEYRARDRRSGDPEAKGDR